MKQLKFNHELAKLIKNGQKTSTFRVNDDKDIRVGDTLQIIDKVDGDEPATWRIIGDADVVEVIVKPFGELSKEDYEGHRAYENPADLLAVLRRYYGPHVSATTPIKNVRFTFKAYGKPRNFLQAGEAGVVPSGQLPTEVKLYADGGSRGNPGPSALGYVICDEQNTVLREGSKYLGITTNNQAEYHALKSGLEACLAEQVREVEVYMDSLLVINQMKGVFKVKNRDLWPIFESIKQLSTNFKKITFSHVPRELNKLADAEVNKALDAIKA